VPAPDGLSTVMLAPTASTRSLGTLNSTNPASVSTVLARWPLRNSQDVWIVPTFGDDTPVLLVNRESAIALAAV
jgi:hypothetical protein